MAFFRDTEALVARMPADMQAEARAEFEQLRLGSLKTDKLFEGVQQSAARRDAVAKALPRIGMKPTTAIVAAVAVGGLVYGATKLVQRRHERQTEQAGTWAAKIESERAASLRTPQR